MTTKSNVLCTRVDNFIYDVIDKTSEKIKRSKSIIINKILTEVCNDKDLFVKLTTF